MWVLFLQVVFTDGFYLQCILGRSWVSQLCLIQHCAALFSCGQSVLTKKAHVQKGNSAWIFICFSVGIFFFLFPRTY